MGRVVEAGMMDALTSRTLFTKKERKLLQSLIEVTGTSGCAGVTILLMVSNNSFGFRLLAAMRLAK